MGTYQVSAVLPSSILPLLGWLWYTVLRLHLSQFSRVQPLLTCQRFVNPQMLPPFQITHLILVESTKYPWFMFVLLNLQQPHLLTSEEFVKAVYQLASSHRYSSIASSPHSVKSISSVLSSVTSLFQPSLLLVSLTFVVSLVTTFHLAFGWCSFLDFNQVSFVYQGQYLKLELVRSSGDCLTMPILWSHYQCHFQKTRTYCSFSSYDSPTPLFVPF